jgi:hypothetical protein
LPEICLGASRTPPSLRRANRIKGILWENEKLVEFVIQRTMSYKLCHEPRHFGHCVRHCFRDSGWRFAGYDADWKSSFYTGPARFEFVLDGEQVRELQTSLRKFCSQANSFPISQRRRTVSGVADPEFCFFLLLRRGEISCMP